MFNEDLSVFFQPGDPGIEAVSYLDGNDGSQTLYAEFITHSVDHESGSRLITQLNPAIKLPEVDSAPLTKGRHVVIKNTQYEVLESGLVTSGIALLYLGSVNNVVVSEPDEPTSHRWGRS